MKLVEPQSISLEDEKKTLTAAVETLKVLYMQLTTLTQLLNERKILLRDELTSFTKLKNAILPKIEQKLLDDQNAGLPVDIDLSKLKQDLLSIPNV
jgi:hypothetical protein